MFVEECSCRSSASVDRRVIRTIEVSSFIKIPVKSSTKKSSSNLLELISCFPSSFSFYASHNRRKLSFHASRIFLPPIVPNETRPLKSCRAAQCFSSHQKCRYVDSLALSVISRREISSSRIHNAPAPHHNRHSRTICTGTTRRQPTTSTILVVPVSSSPLVHDTTQPSLSPHSCRILPTTRRRPCPQTRASSRTCYSKRCPQTQPN